MTIKSKWIEYLYRLATGTKRGRTLLTPVGAIIFGLFTTLFVISALAFDRWLGLPKITSKSINLYIASPILLASTYVTLWSIIHFLKSNGTPVPVNPPPRLVTTGPYVYIRNPMLTGIFVLLFGIGVMIGSISLTFIFTPLFILVNAWELKEIEEPELVRRLGAEYIVYRNKTPMFIPTMKLFKKKKGK
jgi:protein-S-isoprenylcysteine O-methyltransferase Ste14